MSELNQPQTSQAFNSLEHLLLENLNSNENSEGDDFSRLQEMLVDPEVLKMRDRVSKLEHAIPNAITAGKKISEIEKELNEEIFTIKQQLEELEKEFKKVEEDLEHPKDIIKLTLPIMAKMMNRQLNQFKTEIVQTILQTLVPIIEQSQENKKTIIEQHQEYPRTLSIRVVGTNPETEENCNR